MTRKAGLGYGEQDDRGTDKKKREVAESGEGKSICLFKNTLACLVERLPSLCTPLISNHQSTSLPSTLPFYLGIQVF